MSILRKYGNVLSVDIGNIQRDNEVLTAIIMDKKRKCPKCPNTMIYFRSTGKWECTCGYWIMPCSNVPV